jgi:glycosyltransferase involved in cell wall biosynthesis
MLHFLEWMLVLLTIGYAILLMAYRYWFDQIQPFQTQITTTHTFFTIVIPARNEAVNIKACIDSILLQDYPHDHFEIIVMDDFSTDDTAFIVQALHAQYPNVHLFKLSDYFKPNELNAFKKKAIEKAVSFAKGTWIVTTDADCIVPPTWLSLYNQYIQKEHPIFIATPVMFIKEQGILNQFQILDFLALQGITAASVGAGKHSMSNGANLAFEKSAFIAVGGYQGVDHIASGDDMFLMHKMKATLTGKIGYLFHAGAIVRTKAMDTWRGFVMQRMRWSSKARYYDDRSIFWVLVLVYAFNLSFLLLFLAHDYASLLIALAFKTFFELYFLDGVAGFFQLKGELRYFPLYQPLHILYTLCAGFFGQVKTYSWKGRKVK